MSEGAWISGMALCLGAINLNIAAGTRPDPNSIAFDAPIRRVFFTLIAGMTLVLHTVLAVQASGVVAPALVLAALSLSLYAIRRRATLYRAYASAPVLTIAGVFTILPLWQSIYADRDFGFRDVIGDEAGSLLNSNDTAPNGGATSPLED